MSVHIFFTAELKIYLEDCKTQRLLCSLTVLLLHFIKIKKLTEISIHWFATCMKFCAWIQLFVFWALYLCKLYYTVCTYMPVMLQKLTSHISLLTLVTMATVACLRVVWKPCQARNSIHNSRPAGIPPCHAEIR